ncbi:hypothetical protein M408DRAFT_246676 [Serendipita vermifera MAFF 305830]|uniref:Metallo-beta-lactamase domain-containing protein n=1 Tax=Serendipita vermifera MAFF 305830 TaxID=933852 RepID=A0A0C2WBX6_SERVB|nr:hypothetical protein M408DRAFT_246676 [Serendipita vermifera MAFF 305830]
MAFELAKLAPITKLSANVIRVLGQNPGQYTLQGTNTYLVGKKAPYILVDTGEGRPDYPGFLKEALSLYAPQSESPVVSDIIITHKHRDHHGGIPSITSMLKSLWEESPFQRTAEYPAPALHKFPLPADQPPDEHLRSVMTSIPQGTFKEPPAEVSSSAEPCFHPLSVGQILQGEGVALQVIHTPGHTSDSICLYIPEEGALFTADSVLGHGTAVFEDLSTYITSLQSLLDFKYEGPGLKVLYPGHGPALEGDAARGTIQMYISHRLEREQQLVDVLKTRDTNWTVGDILTAVYPEHVRMIAKRGVLLHLSKLERDGRVSRVREDGEEWKLLQRNNNVQ